LNQSESVPQIDEDEPAEIAAPMDPTRNLHRVIELVA
jgi:hypothetical protein